MSKDIFGPKAGADNSGSSNDFFDLDSLAGIRSNESEVSEQVEKLLEDYNKLAGKKASGLPYKLTTIRPEWLDDKELVIMYLQANGKTAITPILFGAETVDEEMFDSKDRMVRAANYNITKWSRADASQPSTQTQSRFLKLCVDELISLNLIEKQDSYDRAHLDLGGCIIVKPEINLPTMTILSAATSEFRACLWALHGTSNFKASEKDMNYLNHTNVTTVVDLSTASNTKDILGDNVFSPLLVRLSHYRTSQLSSTGGKNLTPKLEIPGYLDFRPLTRDEIAVYVAANKQAPLIVPQFVMTGLHNRISEGVVTPSVLLDAIAGIAQFRGDDLVKMMEQSAQYSTTIDTACSTYDWNQLGTLLALQAAERGAAVTSFEPRNPVHVLTGAELPTPVQSANAYAAAFAPLEILIDVPQSGYMAKVRQQLLGNLNFYHHKLTGAQNTVVNALGAGGLVPHGTFTRVSEKAQERRDIREAFNTLGMLGKFHHGSTYTDNFLKGFQHAAGHKMLEGDNPDRDFKERYKFLNETLFEDGSFRLESEHQRILISREYLDRLTADLASKQVTYQMRHTGAEIIARITRTQATSASIDFQNIY